jgi:hypothetical protein
MIGNVYRDAALRLAAALASPVATLSGAQAEGVNLRQAIEDSIKGFENCKSYIQELRLLCTFGPEKPEEIDRAIKNIDARIFAIRTVLASLTPATASETVD